MSHDPTAAKPIVLGDLDPADFLPPVHVPPFARLQQTTEGPMWMWYSEQRDGLVGVFAVPKPQRTRYGWERLRRRSWVSRHARSVAVWAPLTLVVALLAVFGSLEPLAALVAAATVGAVCIVCDSVVNR